jgi:thiol-disulfide isomerase/thioredoxin
VLLNFSATWCPPCREEMVRECIEIDDRCSNGGRHVDGTGVVRDQHLVGLAADWGVGRLSRQRFPDAVIWL